MINEQMARDREEKLLPYLDGKRVFVTGGTGSFGKTFVNLCLKNPNVKEIVVYSRDEQKHVALQREYKDPRLTYVIGDVRDRDRLMLTMRGMDFVFNAAAIKHVHFTEEHPMEAVGTNVIGAHNVAFSALQCGVESLITISTDKAVEPVNTMGMSKAIQERIVGSYAGKGMRVGIVRYGNVLASNGSVVPLYKSMLERGVEKLPITDNRMTRFVLTLPESVHLVLHALKYATVGETFVLDSPAFFIKDVAEVMANYAGRYGRKVAVEEIGIRPGEKMHETLISPEEMRRAERGDYIWKINRYTSGEQLFASGQKEDRLASDGARMLNHQEIEELLEQQDCLPDLG